MTAFPEGCALVYCQGAFNTTNGKTAHGLVRFTRRYRVGAIIDSTHAGQDAGLVLDGKACGIPILESIEKGIAYMRESGHPAAHLVVGLAPDGGRLSSAGREDIYRALKAGLNVDCGLHDFLSQDATAVRLANEQGVVIRDIRKPPAREHLHFFSGKIEQVEALKVAVLGTDSAIGKRTTAWLIVQALEKSGCTVEMVGTGQTAWMQGAAYGIILDSLINDFVSGEIEHAVWSAWNDRHPQVIVIEGQGSLMNPAYPGGYEILAAGRPDLIILQHAPARREYDGFPGYPIQPLPHQIQALEMISGKKVVAITINHERLKREEIPIICTSMSGLLGLPVYDVLLEGADPLAELLIGYLKRRTGTAR